MSDTEQEPTYTAKVSPDNDSRVSIFAVTTDPLTGSPIERTVFKDASIGWLENERVKIMAQIETAEEQIRSAKKGIQRLDKMLVAARAANLSSAAVSAVAALYAPEPAEEA